MKVEFEPEYLEKFKAYVRVETIIVEALYVLSLMRFGKASKGVKERVLEALNSLRDELASFRENRRYKTYAVSILCRDDVSSIDNILTNIQKLIKIIGGKERISDEEYQPLKDFFLNILTRLIKESEPLEEKVLGRPRTHYT